MNKEEAEKIIKELTKVIEHIKYFITKSEDSNSKNDEPVYINTKEAY